MTTNDFVTVFMDDDNVDLNTLTGFLSQPTEQTLRIHDELRRNIQALDSMNVCCTLYDSAMFQECLRLLHKSQIDFLETMTATTATTSSTSTKKNLSILMAKEAWAKHWAMALSRDDDWAWALNHCRKTALMLLFKVCDLCQQQYCSMDPFLPQVYLEATFQKKRINHILYICVVMDRANCLYNMRNSQTGEIGLGWYSKGDEDDYKALCVPPLPLNPEAHTINRRLRWLQTNLYAEDQVLKHWLTIAAPPMVDSPPFTTDLLTLPTEETLRSHDKLRNDIRALTSVDACCGLYDSAVFQECFGLLHQAKNDFINNSTKQPLEATEEWAKYWALALSRDEGWAVALNCCRKSALMLLYKVCDLCRSMDPPRPDFIETYFQTARINRILYIGVVMDRANCLYNMRNSQTGEIGLGWYSKGDEGDYKALRDPPLPLNPESHTINKRLRWLQMSLYPEDEMLKRWLTIAAPPNAEA